MLDLMTTQKFSIIIEDIEKEKKISYMDDVTCWCDSNQFEIETAAKLINSNIKEKIKYEAQELNFLEKPNRLPI